MVDGRWVPLRVAWHEALYGVDGFYRRNRPADHFRTSAHASAAFAEAVVELARRSGITSVCDIGAGGGELITRIHALQPTWALRGIELRDRPHDLPEAVDWLETMPSGYDGLVFANELLDNVPCDVVELDSEGDYRTVEIDRSTRRERLGAPVGPEELEWISTWWPLAEEGCRAEIGLARDALWAKICAANPAALCIAVDFAHCRADRPVGGSLSSYRAGVQTPVSFDGRHDITAHVAFDSLACRVGGTVRRQRDVLLELGLSGRRPPIGLASDDPPGYLRALSRATEVAELIEPGGLGDFAWLLTGRARDTST